MSSRPLILEFSLAQLSVKSPPLMDVKTAHVMTATRSFVSAAWALEGFFS